MNKTRAANVAKLLRKESTLYDIETPWPLQTTVRALHFVADYIEYKYIKRPEEPQQLDWVGANPADQARDGGAP